MANDRQRFQIPDSIFRLVRRGEGVVERRCFTIVEAIVASAMLLIAVLGSSSFYFYNRRNLQRAQLRRRATWAAVDKMEELQSGRYEGTLDEQDNTGDPDDISLGHHAAVRTVGVEYVFPDSGNGENGEGEPEPYRKVTVTVSCVADDARFPPVTLVTYIKAD